MKISPLQIGNLKCRIPIIQGGMGVGVSLSGLASAVAREGGVGVISGVQIGFKESDFEFNTKEANLRALKKEIRRAKEMSNGGILGVNLMVAMNNYEEMVRTSIEEGVDLIISGAGLPTNLPQFVKNKSTKVVPIVSSAKAANVIFKLWERRYSYVPDLVVVEGPEAGGHLGFEVSELNKKIFLEDLYKDVKKILIEFEKKKYNKKISLAVAGGIYDGKDIAKYLKLGADAVQMGTRFIATDECDADLNYKQAFLNSKKEDIDIIKSPVGLPGRVIKNKFSNNVSKVKEEVHKCFNCLKRCNPKTTQYCISKALINSVNGNIEEGIIFSGSNGYKIDKIKPVKELIKELIMEVNKCE
ncbi:2-nitropropane dioxygenase [Clostridium tetani]|uniref:Probable nitronate monooxygenase n=1 Tax=Clostridium tetani TaxID=1513 RepID=A0ABC8EHA7_CLOTA|nr:nitronate monooxygenase family protein [Clostridium tetani]BDR82404.1 2-nitropropane dioxygenase [Clostridium tetani]BDR90794.1 2-nitropropane dioxygenase [Clostridium tetani]